jgi:hypothetical protein
LKKLAGPAARFASAIGETVLVHGEPLVVGEGARGRVQEYYEKQYGKRLAEAQPYQAEAG